MTVSIEEGSGIVIGRPDCDLHFGRQMQGGHASLKDIQGAMLFSAVSTNQSCPASRNAENAVSLVGYNDADSKRNPPLVENCQRALNMAITSSCVRIRYMMDFV